MVLPVPRYALLTLGTATRAPHNVIGATAAVRSKLGMLARDQVLPDTGLSHETKRAAVEGVQGSGVVTRKESVVTLKESVVTRKECKTKSHVTKPRLAGGGAKVQGEAVRGGVQNIGGGQGGGRKMTRGGDAQREEEEEEEEEEEDV
eukprot:3167687-Rhodomonas_salina.1